MAQNKMQSSSATSGFFQKLPTILPQYSSNNTEYSTKRNIDDVAFARILALHLPQPIPARIDKHLHDVARLVLEPSTQRLTVDAEVNPPTLHAYNTFGQVNEIDALHVGEGWQRLKDMGIHVGAVALGYSTLDGSTYSEWNMRVVQFATNQIFSPASALTSCPAAMSDGAAILLSKHLNDVDGDQPGRAAVLAESRKRLISFDPTYAWTSGQWMTERSGGSDVSRTETIARRMTVSELDAENELYASEADSIGLPLGPWKIDGFKWFSSATDADMVVLLARTNKGISVFYAPLRRRKLGQIVMNGVRITRLKQKLGTKALPTSELEIKSMRAWLVGEEGAGIKEISVILNTTRLWTGSGAVAGWARGLAISRAYSRARQVKGKLLIDNAQHVRWMADETVKYTAALHFAFLGIALNGVIDQTCDPSKDTKAAAFLPSNKVHAGILLRGLTPVLKAQCSLASVEGLRATMESLGGLGYCENVEDGGVLNIARLYRDVNVNPIWEGTVSVMVEDFVRVFKGRTGTELMLALDGLLENLLKPGRLNLKQECIQVMDAWTSLKQIIRQRSQQELLYQGRTLLRHTETVVCAALLIFDANTDGNEVAGTIATRWINMRMEPGRHDECLDLNLQHTMDKKIFLGEPSGHAILHSRM